MSHERFAITRQDGRSNQQVLIDHVKDAEPGTLYGFPALIAVLSEGTGREWANRDVTAVVTTARARLLREHKRALRNVRGTGYKLAHAKEHVELSLDRSRRADGQLQKGLQLLQKVRLEEMDENARNAHQGMLMTLGSMWQAIISLDKRQQRVEEIIHRAHGLSLPVEQT